MNFPANLLATLVMFANSSYCTVHPYTICSIDFTHTTASFTQLAMAVAIAHTLSDQRMNLLCT